MKEMICQVGTGTSFACTITVELNFIVASTRSSQKAGMMEKGKLERIEEYILDFFRRQGTNRLLTKVVFNSTTEYANADLVRAFEDLEKKWRLLVRFTQEGHDWISLTPEGAKCAGLTRSQTVEQPDVLPHPPKSST